MLPPSSGLSVLGEESGGHSGQHKGREEMEPSPTNKTKLNSVAWVCERTILSNRRLSVKLVPTFADRGCHVVSVTDHHTRNLRFLGWSRYFFFQVAPQLYSRGWVDPIPDPLLLRKFGSAGNWTWTSGSVARNSDHWITETVYFLLHNI
jgi:hypothetical protein